MLDEFRSTNITWDKATSRIYSPVTANESDENGRKLVVQIVNSGQVEDLTGATLHLYWETRDKAHDGLDVFKAADLKKGEFELSYTTGMLSNKGVLNANLVLIDTVGRVVSERFEITVTEGIDNDAIQSENSFSSLTQALIDISNLEQNYSPRLNDLTAQLQQTNAHVMNVVDITKEPYLLTSGGSVDVSTIINQAMSDAQSQGFTVYIPFSKNPYMIDPANGVLFKNGVNLLVDDGVTFKSLPSNQTAYRILNFKNVENVSIYGKLTVIGERATHLGTTGEWGMGLEFLGASNIHIDHVTVKDCWGDGVYIGRSTEKAYSENIVIDTLISDNNRRQGLSVVSVKTLRIGKAVLTNTNGTSPEAGVDFEPNQPDEFLEDIIIEELVTRNNTQSGLLVYLGAYLTSTNPISIWIKKHTSYRDQFGHSFAGGGGGIKGEIRIDNAFVEESDSYGTNVRRYPADNPHILLNDITIKNAQRLVESTNPLFMSAIIVNMTVADSTIGITGDMIGNVSIVRPHIIDTRNPKKVMRGIHIQNEKYINKAEKISVINPVKIETSLDNLYNNSVFPIITDLNGVFIKKMNDTDTVVGYDAIYTNEGNTSARTLTIGATQPIGTVLEIVLVNNNRVTIVTNNAFNPIKGFSTTLYSEKNGSRLKIRKILNNQWEVLNIVGTWVEL